MQKSKQNLISEFDEDLYNMLDMQMYVSFTLVHQPNSFLKITQ